MSKPVSEMTMADKLERAATIVSADRWRQTADGEARAVCDAVAEACRAIAVSLAPPVGMQSAEDFALGIAHEATPDCTDGRCMPLAQRLLPSVVRRDQQHASARAALEAERDQLKKEARENDEEIGILQRGYDKEYEERRRVEAERDEARANVAQLKASRNQVADDRRMALAEVASLRKRLGEARPRQNILYIGLSKPHARKFLWNEVWCPLLDRLDPQKTWHKRTEDEMTTTFANGSIMYVSGTDDVRHIESFLGNRLNLAIVDEAQSQTDSVPANPNTKGPTAAERARALVHGSDDGTGRPACIVLAGRHSRRCDALTSRVTPLVEALERIARNDEDCDVENFHIVTSRRALAALDAASREGR